MAIILGLDVGTVRIGVASADSETGIATPLPALEKAQGRAEAAIVELVRARGIKLIVVGLPLNEDGSRNQQCSHVENFCRRLKKRIDVELEFFDEYLSSAEARELLGGSPAKMREARERGLIDSMAASIILKNYLESKGGLVSKT